MKTYKIKLCCFLLLSCFCLEVIYAQPSKVEDSGDEAFSEVPIKTRKKLKSRLQKLISFQKDNNYEKIYELLSESSKKTNSKETFVKAYENSNRSQFLKIQISGVYLLVPNNWIIFGCGEYLNDKKKEYYKSQVIVVFENNNWYFTTIIAPSGGLHTPPPECEIKEVK